MCIFHNACIVSLMKVGKDKKEEKMSTMTTEMPLRLCI